MKRQLSNTIYGLKFAMEKNDFEQLKSSGGKKRNDFFANPIHTHIQGPTCESHFQSPLVARYLYF